MSADLDQAVARILGINGFMFPAYSKDWSACGPLVEHFKMSLHYHNDNGQESYDACINSSIVNDCPFTGSQIVSTAATAPAAICQAIVECYGKPNNF